MKSESQKILVGITGKVAMLYSQAVVANNENDKLALQGVMKDIAQIIRLELPQTNTKFNMWNYVAKDEARPTLCSIFHDGGYKVATDSKILVALREDYEPVLEGKMLLKNGTILNENEEEFKQKYPNWKAVIPTDNDEVVTIDLDEFYKGYKDYKGAKKLHTIDSNAMGYVVINLGETEDGQKRVVYYSADHFKLLADVMKEYGVDKIKLNGANTNRPALVEFNESKVILMPMKALDDDTLAVVEPVRLIRI